MHKPNAENKLLEPEIKAMVVNHLIKKGKIKSDSCLINEFTIENFKRRVDLVVVDKKYITAIEVKSEADSLIRLEGQTEKYLEYFDKVIIVADFKHIEKILEVTPVNVAVWEVSKEKIIVRRRGNIQEIKNKNKIINFMKKNELIQMANKFAVVSNIQRSKTIKEELQKIPLNPLKSTVLMFLKQRFYLTHSLFFKNVGKSPVLAEHIEYLSPYREARKTQRAAEESKSALWKNWESFLNSDTSVEKVSLLKE